MLMPRETIVLFTWDVGESLRNHFISKLGQISDISLVFPSDTSQETLLRLAPSADIIVGWRPTRELLTAASKLRLFINPGAGIQHLLDLCELYL